MGRTPLSFTAERWWNATCVDRLLAAGAEVDPRDVMGRTPLSYALTETHSQALLAAGADAAVQDAKGHTPLWWAIQEDRLGIAKLLLEKARIKLKVDYMTLATYLSLTWESEDRIILHQLAKEKSADIQRATGLTRRNSIQMDDDWKRSDLGYDRFDAPKSEYYNIKEEEGTLTLPEDDNHGAVRKVQSLNSLRPPTTA
jgi:ankyrin repeat protein